MEAVTYRIKAQEETGSEMHRGPGAKEFLIRSAVVTSSRKKTIVIEHNKAFTSKVRFPEHQIIMPDFVLGDLAADLQDLKEGSGRVFGAYTYAETVGLWMQYGRENGSNLLSPFISTDSFEFSPAEFLDLRERLAQTIRKYARLPRASAALEDLNTGFFRHQTLEESRAFLSEHLERFLTQARALNRRYLQAVNGYARRSAFRNRRELADRKRQFKTLQNMLSSLGGRKERRKRTTDIRSAWAAYRSRWYQDADSPKAEPDAAKLAEEAVSLEELTLNLNREQAAAALALNHLTIDPALGDAAEFQQLAEELETLVREIDEAGIYQLPLSGAAAATASRQLQRLENVLERLSSTYAHLGELDTFYARRHYWYAQPARLRRLMAPLLELPETDWEAAFGTWYFDRCLEKIPVSEIGHLRTEELALLVVEEEQASFAEDKVVRLALGERIPDDADVVIDLTGGSRPKDFTGQWYGISSLGDTSAQFHALAGELDSRLTLLQPFQPLGPAKWSAVIATEPPPDCAGRVGVQWGEKAPWMKLEKKPPQFSKHLRLYLPMKISAEDGEILLEYFDRLLLESAQLTIFHNWSQNDITQALLTDGFNPDFLAAALLRAAEACTEEPFDRDALVAVGREILTRCGVPLPTEHPLTQAMLPVLQKELPDHFLTLHQPWRDTFLPLVVQSPSGQKTVLLPGGRLPGMAGAYEEALRQRELRIAGLNCLEINAVNCWEDAEAEARRVAERIRG